MDAVSKSSIRLVHWIEHNMEHLKSYAEVAETLEKEGSVEAAKKMKDAMQLIKEANLLFEQALDSLGTNPCHDHSREGAPPEHGHPQKHIHKHIVEHTHQHDHTHEHCCGESPAHGHDHEHES